MSVPQKAVQHDRWWVKRNYLDIATRGSKPHIPIFRAMRIRACLNFRKENQGLGPWYSRYLIGLGMTISKGAKICINLTGDHKGIVFDELYNPVATIRGIRMDTWTARATPREVNVYGNQLWLSTLFYNRWFYFWKDEERLEMNPLIKFRDRIPLYYRVSDGRRLSLSEYHTIYGHKNPDPNEIKHIPLLYAMVYSGRVPHSIPFSRLIEFIKVWSKTWSKKYAPKNLKERIAQQAGGVFTDSIGSIEGSVRISPDIVSFPGFLARFKNSDPPELQYVQSKGWPYRPKNLYTAKLTFKTNGLGQMPYHISFNSNIELEQLYLRNFIDLGETFAGIHSNITIDRDGSEFVISIPDIRSYLRPFRYGSEHPDVDPLVETTGGYIYGGRPLEGIPSGFQLVKNKGGDVNATLNLVTRHEIRTSRGEFSVRGDFLASIGARWVHKAFPRILAGRTRVEIQNFRIYHKGKNIPVLSRAKLIITDDPDEKKIMAVAHPRFRTGSSGFIVRLELDDLNGLGYRKGYVVGFIPVPRDLSGKFYDRRRFSVQQTLNLAFELVTKDLNTKIRGNVKISQINKMSFGKGILTGQGIHVRGSVVSISGGRTRHLIKNGQMKIISRWVKGARGEVYRKWYALIRADHLRLPSGGLVYRPYARAKLSASSMNGTIRLKVDRMYARFLRIRSRSFSVRNGTISMKGMFSYNRRRDILDIRKLGVYAALSRITPRGFFRATGGKFTSFDLDGYLTGHWRHDLRRNRGSGWLGLIGDKEGDIHLRDWRGRRVGSRRLGRETPLFSDTRWIALRINGVDPRGWINGQFCLRTDIDLMALKPLGVKHSDYIEWTMSHDNIATLNGIVARSKKYYRDLMNGGLRLKSRVRRGDVCERVFRNMR